MIDPFLDTSLHPYFLYPVHIVRSGFVIRRERNQMIDFFCRIFFRYGIIVCQHPCDKFMMKNHILFKGIARFVYVIDMYIGVVRIHFAPTFVHR